jgi:hypothetical protein
MLSNPLYALIALPRVLSLTVSRIHGNLPSSWYLENLVDRLRICRGIPLGRWMIDMTSKKKTSDVTALH